MSVSMPRAVLLTLLLLGLSLASPAQAATADAGAAKGTSASAADDEGFADVDVTPVVAVPAGKKAPAPSGLTLLGRLHPLLVHLPIGWLLLLLLVELVALRRPGDGVERLARLLLLGTVAVCLPAVVTGLLRADELPGDGAVLDHRNLMLAFSGALLVALSLRWIGRAHPLPRWRRAAIVLLLVVALGLLVVGGHLGGELVRGEAYLPF
jgi:uncharacterized membrane protein